MSSILSRAELERTHTRTLLETMKTQIAALKDGGTLGESLRKLTAELGLGDEPVLSACPDCGYEGIKGAKLCSNCWHHLPT